MLLWQRREAVWAQIEAGATVYVCGDGRRMAPAVRQTLIDIGTQVGGMDGAQASDWFAALVAQGRYRQDVFNLTTRIDAPQALAEAQRIPGRNPRIIVRQPPCATRTLVAIPPYPENPMATSAMRQARVLALCQALYTAALSVDLTLTGLVGYTLAPDKALATCRSR